MPDPSPTASNSPAPFGAPDVRAMAAAIGRAMRSDQFDLRQRLENLTRGGGAGGGPSRVNPQALAGLSRDLERSVSIRAQRLATLPKPKFDQALPVIERRGEIAKVIEAHQVCIICGETGSGKTTQLPQICLTLGRGASGFIGHTQPRRIAARTVAQRIADELSTQLGPRGAVGYKVRFGDDTSPQNFIKLMTDGILLAETQGDRELDQYDTIIIDEAHERSLNIDFLLGYLRQLLPRRPDLKVIVTSATIDPKRLSDHFGGPERAPIVEVSGRTYPVEVRYHEAEEREQDDFEANEMWAILDAIDELARPPLPRGDVLVFLPGEREIRNTAEALRKHHPPGTEILPLFSRLSAAEQMRVFQPHTGRRIVLATNVAETSLTVPGIRYVVDTGLARISRYSHRTKVQRLPIEPISQASANQRAGRCGRVAAGVCIRLFTEQDFASRPAFTDPEIVRTNLASVILQMKSLRLGPVEEFPFVEPPEPRMIRDGYETLHELGAIDETDNLTKLGHELARLPLDPRLGRMLLAAAAENALTEVLVIAAALSVQDPRDRPMERQAAADQAHAPFRNENSDFLTLLNIWANWVKASDELSHSKLRAWCFEHFLSFTRMREWQEVHKQLRGLLTEMHYKPNTAPAKDDAIHRSLLTGLLSNIACKNEAGGGFDYNGARGAKVSIFPGSALFKKGPKWFMAAEVVQTTKLYARTIAKIDPLWLEQIGSHVLKRSFSDPHWQKETGTVAAWERVTLFGLVLVPRRRVSYGPINPKEARDIFIHHALVEGDYQTEAPWRVHNNSIIEQASTVEAKLRRHDVLADVTQRFAFYDARLPGDVYSSGMFEKWRREAEQKNPRVLFMAPEDLLSPEAAAQATPERFPDDVQIGTGVGAVLAEVGYTLDPGAEQDGVTLTVPLEGLAQLDPERCEWLVPGMVREKVASLVKMLPKQYRTLFVGGSGEGAGGGLARLAEECAGVMVFGQGALGAAISEAVEVLRGVKIPLSVWNFNGLPDHLRMNIRVVDHHGKELGQSRDVAEIKARLAGRARRELAGMARARFGRDGLTTWDFDELPERFEMERSGGVVVAYPALADRGESVSMTLADTPELAARTSHAGIRRLFVLACKEELAHRLRSLPEFETMLKNYAPIGTPAELKADLMDLVAERAFLVGQPAIRTREQFDERQTTQWGRLGQVTIEIGTLVARILATRQLIAARMSGGTPRLWASNVADIREHAAYLMPRGFLHLFTLERLREFPRYIEGMWLRLQKLRESGIAREAKPLADLSPHWKRFTGWVARAHAAELARAQADGASPEPAPAPVASGGKPRTNQPLPAARRAAPVVPTDAAEWAARPGSMPAEVETYRWMLEEFRVSLLAQELGTAFSVSGKRLDEQWAKVVAAGVA